METWFVIMAILTILSLAFMYLAGNKSLPIVALFSVGIMLATYWINIGIIYKYNGIPADDASFSELNVGIQYNRGESMKWKDGFAVVLQRADCTDCNSKIYFMKKMPPEFFVKSTDGKYLALARAQEQSTRLSDSIIF